MVRLNGNRRRKKASKEKRELKEEEKGAKMMENVKRGKEKNRERKII